jgi:hypothetical protein
MTEQLEKKRKRPVSVATKKRHNKKRKLENLKAEEESVIPFRFMDLPVSV